MGREIALALAAAGANVAITFFHAESDSQETIAAIERLGRKSVAVRCDLRNGKQISISLNPILQQFGKLDLLVNNAGAYQTRDFDAISAEDWDEMFAMNVRAAFLMSQACAPELKKSGGRIVNIGSLGGIRPWATHVHYCASKAALHMLTQATAKALAPEVAINCVAPGMIDQGERSDALPRFAAKTPMQKNGSAQDVAQAVLFFATCPDFITGQVLAIDGGLGLT